MWKDLTVRDKGLPSPLHLIQVLPLQCCAAQCCICSSPLSLLVEHSTCISALTGVWGPLCFNFLLC